MSLAEKAPVSRFFEAAKKRAQRILDNRERLREVVDRALAKSERSQGALGAAVEQVKRLVRLVRAYARGDYRSVRPQTMILVVAALLYFVFPFDLIPDFILGVGLLDDVAVIGYVLTKISDELERFEAWEDGETSPLRLGPGDSVAEAEAEETVRAALGADAEPLSGPPEADDEAEDGAVKPN